MKLLTERQAALLMYCGQFYAANDQLPTAQAIADNFRWASTNAAYDAMMALFAKGYVDRNTLGKWRFTAKGRAYITEQSTSARWHPTNGGPTPTDGMYAITATA